MSNDELMKADLVKNKLILFVVIPVCLNVLLLSFYYSGNQLLQYLVSPQFEWLHHRSWREFGLLEQLQNVFLLVIIILFGQSVIRRKAWLEKIFFLVGALLMLFLLLEEIDWGIHFQEYLAGQESSIDVKARNWHNREINGEAVVSHVKGVANVLMIVWFLLCPLFATRFSFGALKPLIPSRWFILGFVLSILFSELTHYLDGQGLDIINGVKGSLKGNLSEFRETNTYYLYMLYALQLFRTAPLFHKAGRKPE